MSMPLSDYYGSICSTNVKSLDQVSHHASYHVIKVVGVVAQISMLRVCYASNTTSSQIISHKIMLPQSCHRPSYSMPAMNAHDETHKHALMKHPSGYISVRMRRTQRIPFPQLVTKAPQAISLRLMITMIVVMVIAILMLLAALLET